MKPKKEYPRKCVTVWLEQDTIANIAVLSEKADIPRAKLMSTILELSVDQLTTCDKIGLWQFRVLWRDFMEHLKVYTQFAKEEPGEVGAWKISE